MTRRAWLGGMLGVGMVRGAAAFQLQRHDGEWEAVALEGRVQVVVFWSAYCPRCLELVARLDEAWARWKEQGVGLWIVDANANETLADLRRVRGEWRMRAPLWKDGGALGDHLGSTVTPEAFVSDGKGEVRYQGQFGRYGEEAVAAVMAGKEVPVRRTVAFGCTRKRGR